MSARPAARGADVDGMQLSRRCQDAPDLGEHRLLRRRRQMVCHERARDAVEEAVGERQLGATVFPRRDRCP